MGVQDVNSLLGVGALRQGQTQKELDVARANTLAQQALPYQQVGFMSDIFRGVPVSTTNLFYNHEPRSKHQFSNVRFRYCRSWCRRISRWFW